MPASLPEMGLRCNPFNALEIRRPGDRLPSRSTREMAAFKRHL